MGDTPSKMYQLMIYFAVGTFHFYRDDIIPLQAGEKYGIFAKKNERVIKRVCDEAINLFGYELSSEQIGRAIKAYTLDALVLAVPHPPEAKSPFSPSQEWTSLERENLSKALLRRARLLRYVELPDITDQGLRDATIQKMHDCEERAVLVQTESAEFLEKTRSAILRGKTMTASGAIVDG